MTLSQVNGDGEAKETDLDVVAARWFHRLARAGEADVKGVRDEFQTWLHANESHAEAFARTSSAWGSLDEHAAAPEMMALRQAAIEDSRSAGFARWRAAPFRRSVWPRAIAAALVALFAGLAAYDYLLRQAPTETFSTAIGERRSVTLADNSRVDIDADSQISVVLTPERRLVHVLGGQAYFEVNKDPARPFIVESNGREVIATGTAFNVENLDRGLQVTLVEGHIVVRHTAADRADEDLVPGDQLTDQAGVPPKFVHLDSTLATIAWREGKLLFDKEPLGMAVARLDRYAHQQVLADDAVAKIPVSGAFDAGDTRAFVDAVTSYYPVDAVSEGPEKVLLVRRH